MTAFPGTSAKVARAPRRVTPRDRLHLRDRKRMDRAMVKGRVALVGFMGSGKSLIGRALAERLQVPFVDLDDVIAEKAGKSVAAIFRDSGEVGFRARERSALRELLENEEPMVLSMGGGTYVDPQARQWIDANATSVYLRASATTLWGRLQNEDERQKRPMLKGPDPEATVARLLKARQPAYESAALVLDTDDQGVPDLVERLCRLLRERAERPAKESAVQPPVNQPSEAPETSGEPLLYVNTSTGRYPIEMRGPKGAWIADAIQQVAKGSNVALITDATVADLHLAPLRTSLQQAGLTAIEHVVQPGEGSKSLETAGELYDVLLNAEMTRQDTVVALGGGVVGDLSGFVASTLLRGVAFVQVPTTTLACVDSSVGGKTGINTPRGKNLVGTFYPPQAVLIAAGHLATQDVRGHAAGLVEAVKVAACKDATYFNELLNRADALLAFDESALLEAISKAVALKAQVVSNDEREKGERAVLNYGHTIGHAIEAGEGFRRLHGEAVAMGMVAEAQWAEEQGKSAGVVARLVEALTALRMPTAWETAGYDDSALRRDKKRTGDQVKVPVVSQIGTFHFESVPLSTLSEFVERRRPT